MSKDSKVSSQQLMLVAFVKELGLIMLPYRGSGKVYRTWDGLWSGETYPCDSCMAVLSNWDPVARSIASKCPKIVILLERMPSAIRGTPVLKPGQIR